MSILFALGSHGPFGARVAEAAGMALSPHEERHFEGGEQKFRPLTSVRGKDVYVIQDLSDGTGGSVNDRFMQLLFFLGAVRDAGAARVTAVLPYLPYGRKDRRTKARDPLTSRTMAQLLEAPGTDAVVTLDVHNLSAFENAFRCVTVPLDSCGLFADFLRPQLDKESMVVASPDAGGIKRAQLFRERLESDLGRAVGFAFAEKRRSADVVSGGLVAGGVGGATVIILDDMIVSGGTLVRAAEAFRAAGAREVWALAAHALFSEDAAANLGSRALDRIVVTNTVPPERRPLALPEGRIETVSAAPLFGEAIRRLHRGGSITELLGFPG